MITRISVQMAPGFLPTTVMHKVSLISCKVVPNLKQNYEHFTKQYLDKV
jgi:hypothetical protein